MDASVDAAVDPSTLPQTRDRPSVDARFNDRVAGLWRAIVEDEPSRGMSFFFPLHAYEQVKAIGNPAGDWKRRLVAAYERDIHKLHASVGRGATFVRAEVPEGRARWVEPDEEFNKIGYYRVFHTKLVYTDSRGRERSLDVASLISWRGEWYVVHLAGFK